VGVLQSNTIAMRTVTTISLPAAVAKEVKKEAKEQGFASTSEFMRHVLRTYKHEKLFAGLNKQKEQYRKNPKTFKVLRSLKDLR
jgi:Arc/MetJ-type ribon-helix-helix transcriptional regulator